jgi:hypothetical protein
MKDTGIPVTVSIRKTNILIFTQWFKRRGRVWFVMSERYTPQEDIGCSLFFIGLSRLPHFSPS